MTDNRPTFADTMRELGTTLFGPLRRLTEHRSRAFIAFVWVLLALVIAIAGVGLAVNLL